MSYVSHHKDQRNCFLAELFLWHSYVQEWEVWLISANIRFVLWRCLQLSKSIQWSLPHLLHKMQSDMHFWNAIHPASFDENVKLYSEDYKSRNKPVILFDHPYSYQTIHSVVDFQAKMKNKTDLKCIFTVKNPIFSFRLQNKKRLKIVKMVKDAKDG